MTNLADLELRQARFSEAATHAAEASRLFDDIGDARTHATCLANLAAAELELTDTAAATATSNRPSTRSAPKPYPMPTSSASRAWRPPRPNKGTHRRQPA